MGVVFDLADRISVLVYGKIVASDTPARIRANADVREAYLGEGAAHRAPLLEVATSTPITARATSCTASHSGRRRRNRVPARPQRRRPLDDDQGDHGRRPPNGSIRFKGEEIAGLKPHRGARRGLGYVPETRDIFPALTVRQNLLSARSPARRRPLDDE